MLAYTAQIVYMIIEAYTKFWTHVRIELRIDKEGGRNGTKRHEPQRQTNQRSSSVRGPNVFWSRGLATRTDGEKERLERSRNEDRLFQASRALHVGTAEGNKNTKPSVSLV